VITSRQYVGVAFEGALVLRFEILSASVGGEI